MSLDEVIVGVDLVRQVISPDANVLFGVGFDENLKDEVQVTLIATGFSGKGDEKAAFFSSEAATHVAATNIQRNNAANTTIQQSPLTPPTNVAPQQPQQQQTSYFQQQHGGTNISGNVSVDEDPSIPPFLRKMRK